LELFKSDDMAQGDDNSAETFEQIFNNVVRQRDELLTIRTLVRSYAEKMKDIQEAIRTKRCVVCTLHDTTQRQADENMHLTEVVHCTDDANPTAAAVGQVRLVVLNDGTVLRVVTSTHSSDDPVSVGFSETELLEGTARCDRLVPSSGDAARYTVESRTERMAAASDEDRLSEFAFRVEPQRVSPSVASASALHPDRVCPVCNRQNFLSDIELTRHVDDHFPPDEDLLQ
jgi:hypothetical protein